VIAFLIVVEGPRAPSPQDRTGTAVGGVTRATIRVTSPILGTFQEAAPPRPPDRYHRSTVKRRKSPKNKRNPPGMTNGATTNCGRVSTSNGRDQIRPIYLSRLLTLFLSSTSWVFIHFRVFLLVNLYSLFSSVLPPGSFTTLFVVSLHH
jgi:hypothetical protein